MRHLSRQVSPILVVLVITAALVNTACPTSNDLDRAAKASNELAHDVLLANQGVAEFYKAESASLATKAAAATTPEDKASVAAKQKNLLALKDRIADKLGVIGDKGQKFNAFLIELDKKYPQGTAPPSDVQFIRQNLSELRALYAGVVADLLPFKAQKAVNSLNKDLTTIEKAIKP